MASRESRTRVTATNTASAVFNKVSKDAGSMASSLARASDVGANLTIVAVGLTAASKKLAAVMKAPIAAAIEQERVESQLAAVLKSTGNAAQLSAEQITEMARGYETLTVFSDQAIIGMQDVLLTFTEIGGEGGIFERSTGIILDMASALGTNLKEQSIQVGKALNAPITGVTALADVGVTFTKSQKELIKSLAETGDVAGAQTVILDELQREFGGSAVAARDTFGGALASLGNQWSNLQEAAGEFITQNEGIRDIIADVTEVVGEWSSELEGLRENSEAQTDVSDVLRSAIIGVLEAVQGINTAFAFMGGLVLETVQKLAALTGATIPLTGAQRDLAKGIEETKQQILELEESGMIETLVGTGEASVELEEDILELNIQLWDQERAYKALIEEGIDFSSTAGAINERIAQLSDKLKESSTDAKEAAGEFEHLADSMGEVVEVMEDLIPAATLKDLSEAREEITDLLGEVIAAPGAFDAWSRSWEKLRIGMVGLDIGEQLEMMQLFTKELKVQAEGVSEWSKQAKTAAPEIDGLTIVIGKISEGATVLREELRDTFGIDLESLFNSAKQSARELGWELNNIFGEEPRQKFEDLAKIIGEVEREWERSVENMSEVSASSFSAIFEDWAARQQSISDGFEGFGETIKGTLANAFFEPLIGAESAFTELFSAVLTPVKQLGAAIGDQIFGELIRGVQKYFAVKATQEAVDAATSTGIHTAQAAASVGVQQAAVAAMMPGLAAAASASLVATFGGASAAASLLPGILGAAAAEGQAAAAALAIPLAQGGIFDRSTLANIGEDGLELALPLTKPTRARQLLKEASGLLGGTLGSDSGGSLIAPITIQISGGGGDPELIAELVAEKVDEVMGNLLASR